MATLDLKQVGFLKIEGDMLKKSLGFVLQLVLSFFLVGCQTAAEVAEPTAAPIEAEADTWLVMIYMDGDNDLEDFIFNDLNDAEMVGSTDQVTIVAQMDRTLEYSTLDGDWTTAKRFLVTADDGSFLSRGDFLKRTSIELQDLGEVNSGDYHTLVDFATWAIGNYPADRYALILSDHGGGWTGGFADFESQDNGLTINEIDQGLWDILQATGIGQFDLLGFDACLMGNVEVLAAIAPYAKHAVVSEETIPGMGWAYGGFLNPLTQDPGMDGRALASAVLDAYIYTDPSGLDFDSLTFNADPFFLDTSTLTAVDLSAVPALVAALNELSLVLQSSNLDEVARASAYAQSYYNVFDDSIPSPYLDLGSLMQLLQEFNPNNAVLNTAAENVRVAIQQAIIAERHGKLRPGSTGFSVYFPVEGLYAATSDPEIFPGYNYTRDASRFASASLWDDFLFYFYSGTPIDASSARLTLLDPDQSAGALALGSTSRSAQVLAPALYSTEITAFDLLSSDVLVLNGDPDLHADLHFEVEGNGIGYIYLYTLLYYEEEDSYLVMNTEFVQSDAQEVGGVVFPVWGEDGVTALDYPWYPIVYNLQDSSGEQSVFANPIPYTYGIAIETDEYVQYGTYTSADTGEETYAAMFFQGGEMQVIYTYSEEFGLGDFPSEIEPQVGDTFTIWEEWLEYTNNPEGEYVSRFGGTLTFNGEPFIIGYSVAPAGLYQIGLLVEDLGANTQWATVFLTVTE